MKLYELLEEAKKTGDMIVRDKYNYAIRYCEIIHGFVWCFRYKNGEYSLDKSDNTGYNRVFLNDNLLNDEWYLDPIHKVNEVESILINENGITYTLKNGDSFTLKDYLAKHGILI